MGDRLIPGLMLGKCSEVTTLPDIKEPPDKHEEIRDYLS